MKTAQEIRAGNVVMIGNRADGGQKAEFNKSGRNSAVVKMKPEGSAEPAPPGDRLQGRRQAGRRSAGA